VAVAAEQQMVHQGPVARAQQGKGTAAVRATTITTAAFLKNKTAPLVEALGLAAAVVAQALISLAMAAADKPRL
jgi:multisubunit Na+/H+ antiporter MnhC subunit